MTQYFVCFADQALQLGPLRLATWGVPETLLVDKLELTLHRRETNPEWFERWWSQSLETFARRDLGAEYERLRHTRVCYTVELKTEDEADLVPLQFGWATVRWLINAGAAFALDLSALNYYTRQSVEGFDFGALDIDREISITFETETDQAHGGLRLMHTRGMAKFARPDVFTYVEAVNQRATGKTINAIARAFALGATPETLSRDRSFPSHWRLVPLEDAAPLEAVGLSSAVRLVRA